MAPTYYVSYYWTFGDGTFSREANPVHLYKMPGAYEVNCTIMDDLGNSYISWTYTVYVYDWAYGDEEGMNVSITDRCLRFAIPQKPSQGIGWSIYDDVVDESRSYEWPYPEAVVGTNEIIDNVESRRQLVMDSRTFRIFEIGRDETWHDGFEEGYDGSEIEAEVTWRENSPPIKASAKLRHTQSHIWVKPWFKDRRNTTNNGYRYNGDGFRDEFSVDLYIKTDSSPDRFAITQQVPDNGQIVFDRHVVSEHLQEGSVITGAPWRLVAAQQWYEQQDYAAAPEKKRMQEQTWAMELTEPLLWIGRDIEQPLMNRATAATLTNNSAATTTGPDGYANSALIYTGAAGIPTPTLNITGDFSLSMWVRNLSVTRTDLLTLGALDIDITQHSDRYELDFHDGVNNVDIIMDSTAFGSWTFVVVTRSGNDLSVYENGSLTNTSRLATIEQFNTTGTLIPDPLSVFDIRILGRALSTGAVNYMYRDITEYQGNATCPVF